MNKTWLAGLGIAALLVSACKPSKQTVATVDGHEITKDALADRLIQQPATKSVLQTMILEQVIVDAADKKGVKIADEDINNYFAYRRDRLPPGRFDEMNTESGVPEETRRADARAELALRALATQNAKVSDASIESMYKKDPDNSYTKPEWKQVGLLVTKDAGDAAKAAAALKKGVGFAEVTNQFTIPAARAQLQKFQWFGIMKDTVTNEQGQPLNMMQGSLLAVPAIGSAIKKTAEGQVSTPVSVPTQPGGPANSPERVLIYVKSVTPGGKIPLDEVRNEIKWRIAVQNNEVNKDILTQVAKDAKVDVKLNQFKDLNKPENLVPPQQPAMPMPPPQG